MEPDLISIIMPVKNTAPFLDECLNSIVQQTEQCWELIAVNDHSTDASLVILQSYNDPRITVINNEGHGIIAALQTGYSACRGNFITRMDSDDVMLPEKLAVLKSLLIQHGKGHLAVGQVQYFSAETLGEGYFNYQQWLNTLTATGSNFVELYKECVIPSPCWMVYRSDFERCKGFSPNIYPEDYDLCFRFYEHRLTVVSDVPILHRWRDYDWRTSRTSEHYQNQYFLDLKLKYWLQLDRVSERPLAIWGAGKKGKQLAAKLVEKQIPFTWVCNNVNKIGKHIHHQLMQAPEVIPSLQQPQVIVTVANPEDQYTIKVQLSQWGLTQGRDFFCFC